MSVGPSAGAKLYIAPPGTIPFSPDLYVEVGEIANMGEFGRVYNLITSEALGDRKTRKYKGTYNDGQLALTLNYDSEDQGQQDLEDAVDDDDSYQFKVVLNDARGALTTPTTYTFEAIVMSYTANIGGTQNVTQSSCTLEIQSGTISKTAAA